MMTDVRIEGQSVDLGEELTIPVTLINPHLTYETIPDSRVTVPAAPFSLHNQRLFQYAEIPQAGNDLRRYRTEVLYNGALIYKGLSYVKSADPVAGYELEVSDELDRFFGQFQYIPLTELDLGTLAMASGIAPV